MEAYLLDWLNLLLRWLHLITGAAWIGASFYFVLLDNSLRPPASEEDIKRGVHGDYWAVHGGGFYHSQKYLTGPKREPLTLELHWSKWEAYTTWLSGMGLLAIIYWFGASTYLIDTTVLALTPAPAIGISAAFIALGWLVYDGLCRLLAGRENILAAIVFAFVMLADWTLFQIFGARAAYVHVGAMMGTMMVANVFVHIIPGQKKMVAAIRAGQPVDPTPGIIGKQRSVHNTYFTLPVLFIMISNHYPMTYSHPHGWAVLGAIMLAGVLIRQFFVLRLKKKMVPSLIAIAVALLLGVGVLLAPRANDKTAGTVTFSDVKAVIDLRCVACHAAQPTFAGFSQPPKGVILETADQVAIHAVKMAEVISNRYMPIGNLTHMTEAERALIANWFAQGATTK
ncbi:MAG: urate hydroxylase PuuD [Betaproteobacteria bacterium]|nr:urate hydroxylase PuuD [Betaproteobacteria bacterium]